MKKILKYLGLALLGFVLIVVGILTYLYVSADMGEPKVAVNLAQYKVVQDSLYRSCNGSFMRKSNSGLLEIYLSGSPVDRGVAFGKLAQPEIEYQEKVFVDQINEIVPSKSYLKFLRFFTVIFNRNLGKYVPEEFRQEIYGMSLSCTHEYDAIGNPYERQLNYHAAHDIGHAMQEYMLVGCSSFGAWGEHSKDGNLIIGRNFDFYVGEKFAKNKLMMFVNPTKGYKFASITWPGMIGVLSGMNEKGLTVTINAAKGSVPTSAAMPISILAREILQYASTIKEAYAIAHQYHTFVSESLLIGSAIDGRAEIIEKSPSMIGKFASSKDYIVCTNHYQSEEFKADEANVENIKTSDSPARYRRIDTLIKRNGALDVNGAVAILRDRKGMHDEDIGLTNEMSLNQSIAHHAVVFQPKELKMWVSTTPWQSGKFVCYDLKKIFSNPDFGKELADESGSISEDHAFMVNDYPRVIAFKRLVKFINRSIKEKQPVSADSLKLLESINPKFYYTYEVLGDYYAKQKSFALATKYWTNAAKLEIPRKGERERILRKIKDVKDEEK